MTAKTFSLYFDTLQLAAGRFIGKGERGSTHLRIITTLPINLLSSVLRPGYSIPRSYGVVGWVLMECGIQWSPTGYSKEKQ